MVVVLSIISVHLVCSVYDVNGLYSTVYLKLNTNSVGATIHLCIYNVYVTCFDCKRHLYAVH